VHISNFFISIFVESVPKKGKINAKRGERVVYHVSPGASAESWIVSVENGSLRREFATKEEAEKFARQRARLNKLLHVKVHKRDGDIDYESNYGQADVIG
jgi:hypothetical protein